MQILLRIAVVCHPLHSAGLRNHTRIEITKKTIGRRMNEKQELLNMPIPFALERWSAFVHLLGCRLGLGSLARLVNACLDLGLRVPLLLERVNQHEQPQLHLSLPVVLDDVLVRLPHPAGLRGRGGRRGGGPGLGEELACLDVPGRAGPPRGLQPDAVVHAGERRAAAAAVGRGRRPCGGEALARASGRVRVSPAVRLGPIPIAYLSGPSHSGPPGESRLVGPLLAIGLQSARFPFASYASANCIFFRKKKVTSSHSFLSFSPKAYPSPKPLPSPAVLGLRRAATPGAPPSRAPQLPALHPPLPQPRHQPQNYGLVPSIPPCPAAPSSPCRRRRLPNLRGPRTSPTKLSPSSRTPAWLPIPLRLVFFLACASRAPAQVAGAPRWPWRRRRPRGLPRQARRLGPRLRPVPPRPAQGLEGPQMGGVFSVYRPERGIFWV